MPDLIGKFRPLNLLVIIGFISIAMSACNGPGGLQADGSTKTGLSAVIVDTNADGISDGVLIDADNDGRYDGLDSDGDGVVDQAIETIVGASLDLDGDGNFSGASDGVLTDTNQDGIADGVDIGNDGSSDISISQIDETANSNLVSANSYFIRGSVSGLEGTGLILQLNSGESISIVENGQFAFVNKISDGKNFLVIATSPPINPKQNCELTNQSGVLSGADILNIVVDCVTVTHEIIVQEGVGGSVSPSTSIVQDGQTAEFVITPDTGYEISAVTGCGGTLVGNRYTTDFITNTCTVSFSYTLKQYVVSTILNSGGSVTPVGKSVNHGETTTLTLAPNSGYAIDTVSGCGGSLIGNDYTTGAVTSNCAVTIAFIPTFNITTALSANGAVTPFNPIVKMGHTVALTLTPNSSYGIFSVSGCGGSMTDVSTFTTGSISADCTVDIVYGLNLPTVSSLYSNGTNWNDYIKNDGANKLTATNTSATGSETSYTSVIHGGEMRTASVSGKSTCTNLTAVDELNAFEWVCDTGTDPVRMISTGLKDGKYLSGLIDFNTSAWKNNKVFVYENSLPYGQSASSKWWGNPVITDNNGSDGGDMAAGDIRIITAPTYAPYIIGQNKVALVVRPGVTLSGSATTFEKVIDIVAKRFLWIEGEINALDDNYGVGIDDAGLSVFSNIVIDAGVSGFDMRNSTGNWLTSIHASNASSPFYFKTISNNLIEKLTGTDGISGFRFNDSVGNQISDIVSANHVSGCFALENGSNKNTIDRVRVSHCSTGFIVTATTVPSAQNRVSHLVASNNATGLLISSGAKNNIFSFITTTSNVTGISVANSINNVFRMVTSAINSHKGFDMNGTSTGNLVDGLIAVNNTYSGIAISGGADSNIIRNITFTNNGSNGGLNVQTSSNNKFTGLLLTGTNSGSKDCYVNASGEIDPGLDDDATPGDVTTAENDHTGVCTQQGLSDFGSATTGLTSASTFVGPIASDDLLNVSDTDGGASFPSDIKLFDTNNFETARRAWGKNGTSVIDGSSPGRWSTGAGRIWDWTLRTSDTVVLDRFSALPNGSNILDHAWDGTPGSNDNAGCDAMVSGSVWNVTDSVCQTRFLINAIELADSSVGNKNLLCETDDTCLFTPNIASYQGHGNIIDGGAFTDGLITGVIFKKFDTNGISVP